MRSISDLFICHASEDKDAFIRDLANDLVSRGLTVWYDEFSIKLGVSLREAVDRGLSSCRFGVVVLSPAFFAKNWTQWELNGLVAREMIEGREIILPIWLNVDARYIARFSPSLADKFALKFLGSYEPIGVAILDHVSRELPYRLLSGKSQIRILDRLGRTSRWIIERAIKVGSAPLQEIEIERITSDGSVEPIDTNLGNITEFRKEGGFRIVKVVFPEPIAPGTVFTHNITMSQRDTYFNAPDSSYDVTITPVASYSWYDVEVHLHPHNPATSAEAFKRVEGKRVGLNGLTMTPDRTWIKIRFVRPDVGVSHVLSWKDSLSTI